MANNITLKQLYNNRPLFTKVEALIKKGKTFDFILDFLADEGKPMSRGTLANLKSKLKEAEDTGVNIRQLIDKRQKTGIAQVDPAKVSGYKGKADDSGGDVTGSAVKKFWSTQEVLEELIQKGFDTLQYTDAVDQKTLLQALQIYQSNFGDDTHGLSLDAIKQYQVISQARYKALLDVILKYIPEDQQQNAFDDMDKAFDEALDHLEVSKDGKRLLTALSKQGIDLTK